MLSQRQFVPFIGDVTLVNLLVVSGQREYLCMDWRGGTFDIVEDCMLHQREYAAAMAAYSVA